MFIHSTSVIFSIFLRPSLSFLPLTHTYVSASRITNKTIEHKPTFLVKHLHLLVRAVIVCVCSAAKLCQAKGLCFSHCLYPKQFSAKIENLQQWLSRFKMFVCGGETTQQHTGCSDLVLKSLDDHLFGAVTTTTKTTHYRLTVIIPIVMWAASFLFFFFWDGRRGEWGMSWTKWRWRPPKPSSVHRCQITFEEKL